MEKTHRFRSRIATKGTMRLNRLSFSDDTLEENSGSSQNVYVQIATPKSPTSDGFFSPERIQDPVTDEVKQKLLDQVDIEILLKHREYNLVQQEIKKVEAQLKTMKSIHEDPEYAKYLQELIRLKESVNNQPQEQALPETVTSGVNTFVPSIRRSSLRSQDPDRKFVEKEHRTSYGGIRPVIDSNGNKVCVHKRSDGVIVKIVCPSCGRTDFGSAQGFLNHSRLAHQTEYRSQDHAALSCGHLSDDLEQDEIGKSSISKLKELRMNPDKNLAPGVAIEEPPKKKRKNSNKEEIGTSMSYLAKLYDEKTSEKDDFKELVDNVTSKVEVELEEESSLSPGDTTGTAGLNSSFKKGHNRRKSRGGLSAVKFDESTLTPEAKQETREGDDLTLDRDTIENTAHNQYIEELSIEEQRRLTPAQRRRVPTIPNPLRTRSRSSRENSH